MLENTIKDIAVKKQKIAVIGLGYVGFPLAKALSKKFSVIGFDINPKVIDRYTKQKEKNNIFFSNDPEILQSASIFIIAVPTPVKEDNRPDFSALESATELVGRYLKKDTIVIYESTVYPGATEEICIPILEKVTGLKCKDDFKVGYSPERLSPGDNEHNVYEVIKIVSGVDTETLKCIQFIYESVIEAGVYPVSSIRVAEAIKVIENTQRDVCIAFMNEIAMMLSAMQIDSKEVFQGMQTKWNALNFSPGLVGGHCISVDPYYLIYEAQRKGYTSVMLSEPRRINGSVASFISEAIIIQLKKWKLSLKETKILILGAAFKENCEDIRNSKVVDIYKILIKNDVQAYIYDPVISEVDFYKQYKIKLNQIEDVVDVNCILIAVSHKQFCDMSINDYVKKFGNVKKNKRLLFDVKGIFSKKEVESLNIKYMHL